MHQLKLSLLLLSIAKCRKTNCSARTCSLESGDGLGEGLIQKLRWHGRFVNILDCERTCRVKNVDVVKRDGYTLKRSFSTGFKSVSVFSKFWKTTSLLRRCCTCIMKRVTFEHLNAASPIRRKWGSFFQKDSGTYGETRSYRTCKVILSQTI